MKTLRSGGNLFIEYPSVAHSLPSNEQLALIYVCCIIKPSRYNTYNRMYVCTHERMVKLQTNHRCVCVNVWPCTDPHNSHLYQEPGCGVSLWTKNGASTVFCGKNATQTVNCLSDMSCVWFNA